MHAGTLPRRRRGTENEDGLTSAVLSPRLRGNEPAFAGRHQAGMCQIQTRNLSDKPKSVVRWKRGHPFRACFKIAWGPAARDFGCGQGGEAGASPKRAVTGEPTRATAKRTAARRVFAEKAVWLRCSSVTDPSWVCSLVAPRHSAFSAKTGPHGILKQALSRNHAVESSSEI